MTVVTAGDGPLTGWSANGPALKYQSPAPTAIAELSIRHSTTKTTVPRRGVRGGGDAT
jgi:hypothetical protein